MQSEPTKQLSFRLPESLIEQVDGCTKRLRAHGLHVSRADVVRMLLVHALRATGGELKVLLDSGGSPKGSSGRRSSSAR